MIILISELKEPLKVFLDSHPFPLILAREVQNEATTLSDREGPSGSQLRLQKQKQVAFIPGTAYRLNIKRAHLILRATSATFHPKAYIVLRQISFTYTVTFCLVPQLILARKHRLKCQEARFTKINIRQPEQFPNLHGSLELPSLCVIYQLLLLILVAI